MSIPVHIRKGENYSGNSFSATYADSVIGTILAYGGTTAPYGWFLCQGQALSRTEYSELFAVIGTSFGVGDGSTTFNLPDLRGEFLRGAGNNSHAYQGNGGSVGKHQDATVHVESLNDSANTYITATSNFNIGHFNSDYNYTSQDRYSRELTIKNTSYQNISEASKFTSRPTNTSVNFIIKAKYSASPAGDVLGVQDIRDTLGETPIPSDLGTTVTGALSNIGNRFNYSTEEQVVGKWIDGKPLYQKTIIKGGGFTKGAWNAVAHGITNLDEVHFAEGILKITQTGVVYYHQLGGFRDVNYCSELQIQPTMIQVYIGNTEENVTIAKYEVTLQYTKTTD